VIGYLRKRAAKNIIIIEFLVRRIQVSIAEELARFYKKRKID